MLISIRISMFSLIVLVFLAGFTDSAFTADNQTGIPLVINELMASNSSTIRDSQDQYDDWIEIYNFGNTAINVGGMYLTDDLSMPTKWRFPTNNPSATIIPAHGYLLIWADDDTTDVGLHANFKLGAGGEEIGLFHTDGSSLIDSITFGQQTVDISYGRYPDASDNLQFMASPTPGRANNSGYLGAVTELEFSHNRGFYDAPFSVTITTETEGAVIYYTLDGSEPYNFDFGNPTGRVYSGPISISTTTCLRAVAMKSGWKPSHMDTHTYIFIDDVIKQTQQQALDAGYPDSWSGYPADYEMDPQVYNDPDYAGMMREAMLSIPTISIVTDKEYLFAPFIGIYTNPLAEGVDLEWERPTSAELFCSDGSKEFQVNCGLRIQGGHSRHPHKCPKHSFSLRFRGIYGPTSLDYDLFDDWPVDSFDTLHLRGFFNNTWTHWARDQRERTQYVREPWMRDSLTEMGHKDALQGFYVHLYLNGMYWGLYNLHERPDADHYAAYNGGDAESIDAINGDPTYVISDPLNSGSVSDGTIDAWIELKQVIKTRNWEQICQLIDMDNFIDWTILFYFAGTTDIKYGTNWRAAGGGPLRRPWRFYSWDAEHVIENVNQRGIATVSDPTGLYDYLVDIEEFRIRFADRLHKHLFNGGALTTERNIQRWTKRADEIDLAVIAESARWGDYRRDVHSWSSGPYYLYTKNEFWIPEKNNVLNDYFPRRTNIALNYFKSQGLYPNVDAPSFNINGVYQHGGHVSSSARLTLTAPAGTIYYTLDGSDPRLPGTSVTVSGISPAAVRYSEPVMLTKSIHVKARVLDGNTWSAINEATFTVSPVAENLRITEIMYNELTNIGTQTINPNLVRFTPLETWTISDGSQRPLESLTGFTNGINFTFPYIDFALNGYTVVVKGLTAFTAQYATSINMASINLAAWSE